MVARKGDGRAELADPGERDDDILAVDSVERSEEPLAGSLYAGGEANELCSLWAGVSLIDGVSFVSSSIVLPDVPKSV
jgi:hypothetical protein